ncbi:MAG: LicD family protein [Candidatus Choladocola sp.]|nr:LicD family protein [Candidatus Choladocola sp.]
MNEFELDWAQAPVRSELIDGKKLRGAKVLLIGGQPQLQRAAALSFLAWNDAAKAGISAAEAEYENGGLKITRTFSEDTFAPESADYIILSGFCCKESEGSVEATAAYLKNLENTLKALAEIPFKRLLLLSDGRVYGKTGHGFAASEYEAGRTDPCSREFESQYLLQTIERMVLTFAREKKKSFDILRTGLIYGPCMVMMEHDLRKLAERTAQSQEFTVELSPDKTSYICIHDVLTAIQFVLTGCPENKIFNVSGCRSDASTGELAMLLYQNFPQQCKVNMVHPTDGEVRECSGIFLNTQLLSHYGFRPSISLEDGLIILVKSLQNTGEVFIFDNTYLGKLEKVQKILLGYLLEIDRICKKHHIRYFLAGGTLLGAIRHHGFIPWDDDADVMMLREDYDRFRQVVQQELPGNIFMQIPSTEKGNYNPFMKLRINNTMFATEFTGHFMDMHNGIFFDVLSHDRTGNHRWSQKLHLMITMLTRSIVFNKWGDTDIKSGGNHPIICKIVDKAKYLVPMRFALWAQNRSLEFFKNRKTEYLYDGMGRNLKRGAFPAEWLDETVYVDFEGYRFPVPKEYDKYLTYLYGDYMQMIPVSQRRTSHSIVLMDLGEYSDFSLK